MRGEAGRTTWLPSRQSQTGLDGLGEDTSALAGIVVRARACTLSSMLLLLVNLVDGDEELTVLAVSVRLNPGLLDDSESTSQARDLAEDGVHLLQGTVGGLGEEEVHRRNDDGVDSGEHGVGVVLDVLEGNRGDHDNLMDYDG